MERSKSAPLCAASVILAGLLCLSVIFLHPAGARADGVPRGVSYKNFESFCRGWVDAEKSRTTSEDDLMCWAAAASNVLDYTSWGHIAPMSNCDQIFAFFVEHWTNAGGLMDFAWNWWFDGTNDSQGWAGWSQVDVPGGGFYQTLNFWDYYHEQWNASLVMQSIDQFLRNGWGVALALYGPGGHAVTCWGYSYDPSDPSVYYGIWITDSDDDKSLASPPDRLRYYDVAYSTTTKKWYLQNFYGSNSWYIGGVEALELIPEPAAIGVLLSGLAYLIAYRRRFS